LKRYVKPSQTALPKQEEQAAVEPGTFDVAEMLDKGAEILRREISNLMIESSGKKLSPNSAKDLVAYLKLLAELKLEQEKALADMSDEELEAISSRQKPE
jgi:hypothetical protein